MFLSPSPRATPKYRPVRLNVEVLEERATPAAPAGNSILWQTYSSASAFSLHSNPGASKVIYLDFDGETVSGTQWNTDYNAGNPITALAWSMDANRAAFSTIEQDRIIAMWRQVAEDFVPFDVNVTTQDPGNAALQRTNAADNNYGIRVICTPTPVVSDPMPIPGGLDWNAVGGIAYGNFDAIEAVETPCWVFNGDSSATPEVSLPTTVSHEVGHTLGLGHDGDSTQTPPADEYYPGHGAGVTSWGTIMGAAFGRTLDQWSRNTYPGANNAEDDLQIISTTNGFGYRPDDYGNTPSSGKALNGALQASLATTYGVVERDTDFDYFKFYADPGPINIAIDPLFVGPNLDVRADLYGPSGALIMSSNSAAVINAAFTLNLTTKGLHTIRISSSFLPGPTGYPTYGTIGSYRITGTVTPFTPALESFKRLNPVRWTYNRFTGIYDGYITIGNISGVSFTGKFKITLTLPEGVRILSPKGVQTGRTFTLTVTATISPTKPLLLYVRLKNPKGAALSTGANSFVTNIQYVP